MVSELRIGLDRLVNLVMTTQHLQTATGKIKHLAAAVWWSQGYSNQPTPGGAGTQSQQLERYASTVFQSVAVFRLVAFALGTSFSPCLPSSPPAC